VKGDTLTLVPGEEPLEKSGHTPRSLEDDGTELPRDPVADQLEKPEGVPEGQTKVFSSGGFRGALDVPPGLDQAPQWHAIGEILRFWNSCESRCL
jgi:hypothetical protein